MKADETADDHLRSALKRVVDQRIVKVKAPVQLSCAYKGKTPPFKMVRFNGGDELLLKDLRAGKRDPAIFMLEHMGIAEWDHAEIELSKVDKTFPELATDIVTALGAYLAEKQVEAGIEDLDAPFIPSNAELPFAVHEFRTSIGNIIVALKDAAELAAARAAQTAYADNDAWGSW